ncbi:hypothetical protein AB4380_00755 [Vibrio breoganii]
MTLIRTLLIPLWLLIVTPASTASETANEQIKAAIKVASKPKKLLHSNAVIVFGNAGEAVVVSDNPRWVVKGQLFDMWSNVEVKSELQLTQLEQKLPLDKISVNTTDVFDFVVNPLKPQTVTVFIDPFHPNTPNTVSVLSRFATDYRLRFILTPMTPENVKPFLTLNCAELNTDSQALVTKLINKEFRESPTKCDQARAMNSYGLSGFLQITQSPTLVAPNDELSVGMPNQVMKWLATNSKQGEQ